jgi:uncharacterized protein
MPFRLSGVPLLVLIFAVLIGVPRMAGFYTDWLWFEEVGFRQVLVRSITAQAVTGLLTGLAAFGILWINLRIALKALRPREFMIATAQGPQVITIDPGKVRPLVSAAALLVALMVGVFGSSQWDTWLFFLHGTPFGRPDPILGYDIGFYVFTLPLLEMLHGLAMTLVLLTLVAVVAAYVAGGSVALDPCAGSSWRGRRGGTSRRSRPFCSWCSPSARGSRSPSSSSTRRAWCSARRTWTSTRGCPRCGCWWRCRLSVPRWPPGRRRRSGCGRLPRRSALYLVVSVGGSVYAGIIQRFVVAPNEQVRETPFIRHNIKATREGYALDQVEERGLSGDARLTREDLERNSATLRNVPLWNAQPLLDTFSQIQEIRTYYDFVSVDNDRYVIDGQYRQIMLSARELNTRSLPSRTWINDHLTFTHGYGITLGPVNEVTPEGLPVLFIRDLPPVSTHDLQVTQPAIYYGELPNDHVFVRTGTEEFDYPRGEANVFTTYEGDGGVTLSNVFRRLMFAIRFRSTDTFFSPNLTRQSRVMIYRRIGERVGRIAPFLQYDPDPYLAISDGRLIWVQDAYTTTNRYPYSSQASGLNYIRNAVKVTIDAYHGTTRFHLLDTDDPVAATMAKIFPTLFTTVDEMPGDMQTRLRYPQLIFSLQAHMFATFHMEGPAVFYNREDQWEIPVFETGGQSTRMEPYYTIMRLPGEEREEFIQMLPYTPRQKDNLAAWLVARSDGENYGRLMVFQFPKQTLIFGPRQVAARISQDQVIAPQITLWNQQGSEVIQGTLLVIPIEESLIYIRPLYLRAAGGRIPELKRVIVAYQNQIVMEETLDRALDRLFPPDGARRPRPVVEEPGQEGEPRPETAAEPREPLAGDAAALAAQARQHYQRALQAQREGNWALYGEEIKRLGEVLERLAQMNR